MPARKVDYLLIGGGLASGNCARWLREEGAEGDILLVGREPDPPYNRPNCSKGYLRGEEERSESYFRPDEWWQEQRIELLTRTSVTRLDLESRVATLSTKEEVAFDQALLATGANVRRLNVDGCELEGIHYLRSYGNADAIREGAAGAEEVVLVGGSFIACEVAASLRLMGKAATIVMQEQMTLERVFGQAVGRFFHESLDLRSPGHQVERVAKLRLAAMGLIERSETDRFRGNRRTGLQCPAASLGAEGLWAWRGRVGCRHYARRGGDSAQASPAKPTCCSRRWKWSSGGR